MAKWDSSSEITDITIAHIISSLSHHFITIAHIISSLSHHFAIIFKANFLVKVANMLRYIKILKLMKVSVQAISNLILYTPYCQPSEPQEKTLSIQIRVS